MTAAVVYIVDDDEIVRDILSTVCDTAGLDAECYDSAQSFLSAYRPEQAGCLVLDVLMEGMTGPELHAELKRRGSHLPIIYLTSHGDIPMTVDAMKAGAVDFLTKPVDARDFLERVRVALEQGREAQLQSDAVSGQRRRLELLSTREREVMQLAVAGHANKVIAKRLGISHRTVELHRSHILQKTGTSNVLELAQLVAESGLTADSDL